MSTGLTVYAASNAVAVIETMGRAIAKSQFIKCDNVEQGIVLAMTCYSKGIDFLTLAQRYDLIGGRLAMKSDAMLSGLRERGGKHKIVKRTEDEACVVLSYDGQDYESRITWQEAQGEPFIYSGKESEILRMIAVGNAKGLLEKIKPKYASPRARMQMLWARAVSDGVRALCPEVNSGTYTPEEIADFEEIPQRAILEPVTVTVAESPVIDAESSQSRAASVGDRAPATATQIALIKTLMESVSQKPGQSGIAARIKEHINKSSIYKMSQMSELSAQRLIESLNGTSEIDSFFDVTPISVNLG